MHRSHVHRRGVIAALGLAMVWLGGSAWTATIRAGGPESVRFIVEIGDGCVNGGASPADLAFTFVMRDAQGDKIFQRQLVASGGSFATCDAPPVRAGQTLEARKGGNAIHTLVVPRLTLASDRATDVLSGIAPAGDDLAVSIIHCLPGFVGCEDTVIVPVEEVPPDGRYAVDVTGAADIRGGDLLLVRWTGPFTDDVYAAATAPRMEVRAGRATVTGGARAGSVITLRLLAAGGALRGRATITAGPFGSWSAVIRRDGDRVKVKVGDRVVSSHATDATLRVRSLTITADVGAGSLSGTCLPNGEFGIAVRDAASQQVATSGGPVGAPGTWSISDVEVLEHGSRVELWCSTGKGDIQALTRTIP